MSQNIFLATMKFIAIEIIWDVIFFPVWWYSKGLVRVGTYCIESARFHIRRRLALGIWLRSMFKPMFGDYTKEGRIISFFMRTAVLIYKMIATGMWLVTLCILFIAWLLLPLAVLYYFGYQLFNIPLFFTEL